MSPVSSRPGRLWVGRYATAVGLVTATVLVRLWIGATLGERMAFSIFLPSIIVVSYFCGSGPCLMAIGLSLLAADWFFIEPRHSLGIARLSSGLDLALHVTLGLAIWWYGLANTSARHKIEKGLREAREAREDYRIIFELSAVGQAEVDLVTGRFARVNARFCEATGYTSGELSRMSFLELTHGEDRAAVEEAANRLMKGDVAEVELEKRCLRKSGETIDAWISAAVIRDARGLPLRLVAAIRDITPQKRAEKALRHAQSRLEALVAERTAEKEQDLRRFESFCASIAHDLRAPLRAMNNFATLLEKRYGDELPDQAKVYTARLAVASKRMDRLLLDLLEYGRVSSAGFQVASINTEEVVLNLVERIRRSPLGGAADIQLQLPLPQLQANGPLLEQALENLVMNALKFTAPSAGPSVHILAEDQGSKTRLCVEDKGPGIPPQYHQLIFGAFQRLDQSDPKSTGIGLAIVRAAVERMKGNVGVSSAVGRGSKFWIELPKA